jgi:HSP20 family protein
VGWGYPGCVPRDPDSPAFRLRLDWDELAFGRPRYAPARGFIPRVDVYYCGKAEPRAVVRAELPGIDIEDVAIEIRGRQLVIAGERRPEAPDEQRVYQQVEIESGPFRRVVELGADVAADGAEASYQDGVLRVEIPLARLSRASARRVPVQSRSG